jgi:hypothetical protein
MVSAGRHPKKAINQAINSLKDSGFEIREIHNGHRWGMAVCRTCGDSVAIWSTPRVPENHAAAIHRFANKHGHLEEHDADI